MIDLNVKNPIGHGIQPKDTAAKAWAALKDVHDTPSDMGLLNADNAVFTIKHTDGADILTHFTWMHKHGAKVNTQSGKMEDSTFHTIVITLSLKSKILSSVHSFP